MKVTLKILRFVSRHTWWWTVALIILLAIMLTAARLLLPQLAEYRGALERQVSQVIGQPVTVRDIEVGWHGYGPRIYLHDVRMLDHAGETVLFGFEKAYIDVSLPLTIYRGQIALHDLTLSGIELSLVRHADGRISLGEMTFPSAPAGAENGGALLRWLFRQTHLGIEDSTLRWRDLGKGDYEVVMRQVDLFLRNDGERHTLGGRMALPATLGGHVEMMVEAQGGVDDFSDWTVDVYAKGTGLELVQWLVDQPGLGMRMVSGQAELELWGAWRDNRLDHLKGYLSARDAYLAPDQPVAGLAQEAQLVASLFGEFVWQARDAGWTLDVDRLRLVMDGVPWEPARVHMAHTALANGSQLELATDFARVDDIATLLALSSRLSQAQREMLFTTKPRGELHNAYLRLQLADGTIGDYFVRGELNGFALLPWQKLPGFDGLDVTVNMNQRGGVADFSTRGAYVDLRHLFRDFFAVDEMFGRLAWQRQSDGRLLELRRLELANADAAVRLDGRLWLPDDDTQSPLVKLLADFKRGNGEAAARYLPAKIMPDSAVDWLDRAIVAGKVTSGAMVLQGPIERFPFNDASGRFEILFNVSNGILDYHEGWPRVEQIETQVSFIGTRMSIEAVAGKVLDADLKQVAVEIPDLRAHPAVLHLMGRAEGGAADVLDFLNKSPLQRRFGAFTAGAEAAGPAQLDLSLTIPLQPDTEVETHGLVAFDGSRIDFKALGVDLDAISGLVEFSGTGLSARAVKAEVLGQPASLDIVTETPPQGEAGLIFQAEGETRYGELDKRLDLFVFPYLEGQSRWQARLEIPRGAAATPPTLTLNSDLSGTAVNLPPPLQKQAASPRRLTLSARFDEQARHWFFDYGEQSLTGAFRLPQGRGLSHGELHFNGPAELPQRAGLRIAGQLARFDYARWQPLLAQDGGGGDAAKGPAEPSPVNQVDLKIRTVELFGQTLSDASVRAEHGQAVWTADVSSDRLAGKVWLPDNRNNVVKLELDHLYLERPPRTDAGSGAGPGPAAIDPTTLPPLMLTSRQSRYGDLSLGRVELLTRKRASGLKLEQLKVESSVFNAVIKGDWAYSQQRHNAKVNAELRVYDLGALLSGLGYVAAVGRGEGTGRLNLSWNGPLLDYHLPSLNGAVDFDFNDGKLLEVEPGAGRFFGLLSISALPRRLKLDFSDFFGRGFTFDYMRGHFDIRDGNAYTRNFEMDGPAARIELNGRVGLVDEDYDQRVKVVPHVTSGLPTLAGILTGSIAPAVVIALIEKLAKPEVDKATGIYYQVTGSWEAPQVEPVDLVGPDDSSAKSGKSNPSPR